MGLQTIAACCYAPLVRANDGSNLQQNYSLPWHNYAALLQKGGRYWVQQQHIGNINPKP